MKKYGYLLWAAAVSHVGKVRENNEDNLYFDRKILKETKKIIQPLFIKEESLTEPRLFGVFDGMGGHAKGEKASYLAAMEIQKNDKGQIPADKSILTYLNYLCDKANRAVCDEQRREKATIGTTVSMLYFYLNKAYVCNVGDSPVYRFRKGKLESIYQEHTDRAMRERLSGRERADGEKFLLTQHIGIFPEEMVIEPYIESEELLDGDVYLICTDGLTDMVPEKLICDTLQQEKSSDEMAEQLLNLALTHGGKDNITIICIRIEEEKSRIKKLGLLRRFRK